MSSFEDIDAQSQKTDRQPVPLTPIQQSIWVRNRMRPGSENQPITIRMAGPVKVQVLEAALHDVLARHPVLRNTYPLLDDGPRQVTLPVGRVAITVVDHSMESTEIAFEAAMKIYAQEMARPADLETTIVFRPTLVKLSEHDHVLVLGVSHIGFDGWSAEVLTADLEEIYRARTAGSEPLLPDLPMSFAEHARSVASTGASWTGELSWWKNALANLPANPHFPTSTPAPGTNATPAAYEMVRGRLSVDQYRAMAQVAEKTGVSKYASYLVALQLLIAEVTGTTDFLTGFAVHGRPPEAHDLVGCFINPMVVRTRLLDAATVSEQMQETAKELKRVREHSELPHHLLVRQMRPGVDTDGVLHNVHFQMDRFRRRERPVTPELVMENYRPGGIGEETGLVVEVNPDADGAEVRFEFDMSAFDRADVELWASRYISIVDEIIAAPDRRMRPPVPSIPAAPFLTDLVARHANERPAALAIQGTTGSLTYSGLERLANRFAHSYSEAGVLAGDLIALVADHTPETVAAMLGALKIGVGYIPLDPALPRARQAQILEDASPKLLVIPNVWQLPSHDAPPAPSYNAASPAYVIYTSGSTGKPKGVVVSQGALASFVSAATDRYGLSADDRMLQFHSLGFDASVEELHVTLGAGGAVVLRPSNLLGGLEHMLGRFDELELTAVSLPTALWHELVLQFDGTLRLPSDLRLVIIGGEAARSDLVDVWQRAVGTPVRLLNTYGPTETTVVVTAADLTNAHASEHVSIGSPLKHVLLAVCDTEGRDVAPGEWGELWVSGRQLATEYLGRPTLTARSFVNRSAGGRWYRTGDRVRQRDDGEYEISGRFDTQVKVRGHRLELSEIEKVICSYEAVSEAVVSVKGNGADRHLVAHLVAHRPATIDMVALRAELTSALPRYMVPTHLMVLDQLPTNLSGKVDRRALPAVRRHETSQQDGSPDDATVAGRVLVLWRQALDNPSAGMHDDFFDLGGHSLKAVQLMVRIEAEFGVRLEIGSLFDVGTAAGLAELVEGSSAKKATTSRGVTARGHVVMRRGSLNLSPLFLIHAAGGHVMLYQQLVKLLDQRTAVHGLEAPGVDNNGAFMTRIEDVAAVHAMSIRTLQKNGPYRLAGFSVGGTIAFEVARYLRAQDQQVEFMGLIDTVYPVGQELARSQKYSKLLVDRDYHGVNDRVRNAMNRRLETRKSKLLKRPVSPELASARVANALSQAHYNFEPGMLDAPITYYLGTDNQPTTERPLDDHELWLSRAEQGLEVVRVPGSHRDYNMLRTPNVEAIAAHMRRMFDHLDGVHKS